MLTNPMMSNPLAGLDPMTAKLLAKRLEEAKKKKKQPAPGGSGGGGGGKANISEILKGIGSIAQAFKGAGGAGGGGKGQGCSGGGCGGASKQAQAGSPSSQAGGGCKNCSMISNQGQNAQTNQQLASGTGAKPTSVVGSTSENSSQNATDDRKAGDSETQLAQTPPSDQNVDSVAMSAPDAGGAGAAPDVPMETPAMDSAPAMAA
ncbi:hypothetical protein JST97_37450 [bacterium]|nr:hypothetical protein [bacterium]